MLLFYQVATTFLLTTCWEIVELQDDNKLLEQLVTNLLSSTTLWQVVNKSSTTCQQAGNKPCEHILMTSCGNSIIIATNLLQVCYNSSLQASVVASLLIDKTKHFFVDRVTLESVSLSHDDEYDMAGARGISWRGSNETIRIVISIRNSLTLRTSKCVYNTITLYNTTNIWLCWYKLGSDVTNVQYWNAKTSK
jgi:hypothetical protein